MNMKERVRRFTGSLYSANIDYFCIVLMVVLVLTVYGMHFLNHPAFLIEGTDDNAAYNIAKQDLFSLVSSQYMTWTGRITGVVLSHFSAKTGVLFYRLINPLFFLFSGYAIARYFSRQINVRHLVLSLLCLGLISGGALGEAVFWFSGSYSYVAAVAFGLLTMIPYADSFFRNDNNLRIGRLVPFALTGILASMGNEQAAIVMAGAAVFYHIAKWTKKEKISPLFYLLTAILIVFTAANVLAPGNANRSHIEMTTRFPDFYELSIAAHLKLALYCFFNEMAGRFAFVLFALGFAVFYQYKKITGKWRWLTIILLAQMAVAFVAKVTAVLLQTYETGIGRLFNFDFMLIYYNVSTHALVEKLSLGRVLAAYVPFLFWAVFFVILIALTCKLAERPVFVLLCFCAAFVTIAAFYTSPTILVSSERAYYVAFIVFVIVAYYRILRTELVKKNYVYLALAALFAARIGLLVKNIHLIAH